MNHLSRPLRRSALFLLLIAAAVVLSSCGSRLVTSNWAGLSTDGEKVYLANGAQVLAVDVADNAATQSWAFPTETNAAQHFYAAPSVQDGRVIFGDYGRSGGFFSPRVRVTVFALKNNPDAPPAELWQTDGEAHDKIVAPVLQVGDRAYVGTADNHIIAMDANTGEAIWDYEAQHAIWGQPQFRDGVVYVTSMDWNVYALNADTGDLVWSTKLGGAIASAAVLGDDLMYVSSYDGNVHALKITDGEQVWQAPATDWVWASPALDGERVFFGDIQGNIFAVDAKTGEQLWTKATGASVQSAPVVLGDTVYFASEIAGETPTGALTAYATADGQQKWQTPTAAPLYTNPVVFDDDTIVVALASTDALLIGYNAQSGSEQWRLAPPAQS